MSNYFLDTSGVLHKFDAHKHPEFQESKNYDWVIWGVDSEWRNKQPLYYDWLYNSSSKHRAIINRKNLFIAGQGLDVNNIGSKLTYVETDSFVFKINDSNLIQKLSLNELKYGGFCYEIIESKDGKKIFPHYINFGNVRRSKREYDEQGREKPPVYYYTNDWNFKPEQNPDFTVFYPFTWGDEPMDKNKRYLVYYSTDEESLYPVPEYTAAIPYIAADYEVGNFTYNNTKKGFSAGWFVEFYGGAPDEEDKGKVVDYWKKTLHGTDNAGEPAVSFLDNPADGTKLTPLAPNGQDDRFINLNKQIREEIFSGHTINPKVVGLKDENGFANNADELRVAIEEFQSYYVRGKQQELEKHVNALRVYNELRGEIFIKNLPPIKSQVSEQELAQILGMDERRERAGYEKKKEVTTVTTSKQFKSEEDNYIFDHLSKCGISLDDLEVIETKELFATCIEDAEQQAYNFQLEKFGAKEVLLRILAIFGLNYSLIAKLLKVKESDVVKQVEELIADGSIKEDGEVIEKVPEVFTVYSYEKRNDVSGADVISTTRDFCRNLVTLSRTTRWTIDDIKRMNNDTNLDVFSSRGGWYTIPDTNIHTPYCRHIWKTHLVKMKP